MSTNTKLLTPERIAELVELYEQMPLDLYAEGATVFSLNLAGPIAQTYFPLNVADSTVAIERAQVVAAFFAAAHNAMPAILEMLRSADCGCGPHKHRSDTETGAARECLDCECKQFYNVHMLVESLRAELQQKERNIVLLVSEADNYRRNMIQLSGELQQANGALSDIRDRDDSCGCEHDTSDCCAKINDSSMFCARCMAAVFFADEEQP